MAKTFLAFNGPMQTTAAPASVALAAATIKTLMQLAPPSGGPELTVVEWGISFDQTSGVPVKCELIETDVAGTVTAYAAADITKYNKPNDSASAVTLGTSASGYTCTSEGSITAVRTADLQLVSPAAGNLHQFPLQREFLVRTSKFLRVRVTAPAVVNAYCYVQWEE